MSSFEKVMLLISLGLSIVAVVLESVNSRRLRLKLKIYIKCKKDDTFNFYLNTNELGYIALIHAELHNVTIQNIMLHDCHLKIDDKPYACLSEITSLDMGNLNITARNSNNQIPLDFNKMTLTPSFYIAAYSIAEGYFIFPKLPKLDGIQKLNLIFYVAGKKIKKKVKLCPAIPTSDGYTNRG